MIPAFERAKTFHALDRTATLIGSVTINQQKKILHGQHIIISHLNTTMSSNTAFQPLNITCTDIQASCITASKDVTPSSVLPLAPPKVSTSSDRMSNQ
jgi:hypothetical protein